MWLCGSLLMFSVMLSDIELVGIILIGVCMLLLRCMIDFLLNCWLIWVRVVLRVLLWFVGVGMCVIFGLWMVFAGWWFDVVEEDVRCLY